MPDHTPGADAAPFLPPHDGGRAAAAALRELLSRAFPRPVPPLRAVVIERAILASATGA